MSDISGEGELDDRRAGFAVELNERGLWVVRECCGLVEGEFPSQAEALRFALSELGRGYIHPASFAPHAELALASHSNDD